MKPLSQKVMLALACILLLPAFASCITRKFRLEERTLTITRADKTSVDIKAELAVRREERNWGYMKRTHIPEGTGMLFAFPTDEKLRFWMKDTPTPLSIAYIDSTGKIREIHDMKPFDTRDVPCSVYVRYALEVPQGWFEKANVSTGDFVFQKDGKPLKEIARY